MSTEKPVARFGISFELYRDGSVRVSVGVIEGDLLEIPGVKPKVLLHEEAPGFGEGMESVGDAINQELPRLLV